MRRIQKHQKLRVTHLNLIIDHELNEVFPSACGALTGPEQQGAGSI